MKLFSFIYNGSLSSTALVLAALATSGIASAQKVDTQTRITAECGARAHILERAIMAYGDQNWTKAFRTEAGAVNYVTGTMANYDLKPKESRAVIQRTVKYVYQVLEPRPMSDIRRYKLKDAFYRQCMFDAENGITPHIVDLKKTFSKNTNGQYLTKNKDGSLSVCSKGKCETRPAGPPANIGKPYENIRKTLQESGWLPAPSSLRSILQKVGHINENSGNILNNDMFGNCVLEEGLCEESRPEFADCADSSGCVAVWWNNGEAAWYLINSQDIVVRYGISRNIPPEETSADNAGSWVR